MALLSCQSSLKGIITLRSDLCGRSHYRLLLIHLTDWIEALTCCWGHIFCEQFCSFVKTGISGHSRRSERALPDGGLNCWYSALVHAPSPQPAAGFKIRQSSAFYSTLWQRHPSLHMRLWAFGVFGELERTYTSQELHKWSMSCWHRTRNLWPSGRASQS